MNFLSDKFMCEVSHRLFDFFAKLLFAILDLTTCYHVQSSVESITNLIIFLLMFVCARAIVYEAPKNASLFVCFFSAFLLDDKFGQ